MTQRSRLDHYLAEQAASAGVDFRDDTPVKEIETGDGVVTVRSNGNSYRSRTLIGADGANGIVARSIGLATDPNRAAVAFEANVPAENGLGDRWKSKIAVDLGGTPGGYGWLFPKGDHVNVGVGGWKRIGPTLRTRLTALCEFLDIDESKLTDLRGYHLPLRDKRTPIARGNVLLAGDAAGLVDPLSGEGIHGAFVSGRLASEAIGRLLSGESADLTSYDTNVERELMRDISVSYKLQAVMHRFPRFSAAALRRSDRFWTRMCGLVRGESTYTETEANLGVFRHFFNGLAKVSAIGLPR
jgi:flavin-dependent dehydrogenase